MALVGERSSFVCCIWFGLVVLWFVCVCVCGWGRMGVGWLSLAV